MILPTYLLRNKLLTKKQIQIFSHNVVMHKSFSIIIIVCKIKSTKRNKIFFRILKTIYFTKSFRFFHNKSVLTRESAGQFFNFFDMKCMHQYTIRKIHLNCHTYFHNFTRVFLDFSEV
jgi:hypothetical protein